MGERKYIYKIIMKNGITYTVLSDISIPAKFIDSISQYTWQDFILAEKSDTSNVVMIKSDEISSIEYSMDI